MYMHYYLHLHPCIRRINNWRPTNTLLYITKWQYTLFLSNWANSLIRAGNSRILSCTKMYPFKVGSTCPPLRSIEPKWLVCCGHTFIIVIITYSWLGRRFKCGRLCRDLIEDRQYMTYVMSEDEKT